MTTLPRSHPPLFLVIGLASLIITLHLGAPAHAASPADKALEIAQQASIELAGHRYLKAAELMDQAFALDPDPVWRANAGYARMMAGQLERAIEDLSGALADKRLVAQAREQATTRLGHAKAARDARAASQEAAARGAHEEAAMAADRAWQEVEIGPFILDAALLWEKAGDLDRAEERLRQANTKPDLSPDQRTTISESLIRVGEAKRKADATREPDGAPRPPPPPETVESGPPILGWTLVGVGAAAIGLGITGFIISGGKKSDAEAITDPSREAEFEQLDADAETWWNVGLIASGVGLASAVTGVILVATHDGGTRETRGSVDVGGATLPGGGMVTTTIRF